MKWVQIKSGRLVPNGIPLNTFIEYTIVNQIHYYNQYFFGMIKKILLISISFYFISCNRLDFSNPKDVVSNYRKLSHENKSEALYTDFLANKSKEFVTKDEFAKLRNISDSVLRSTKYIESKITEYPTSSANASFRRFKVEETSITKEDTAYLTYYYTLTNENGKWKILWTGSLKALAEEKFDKGNYTEARKLLDKIITINPFEGSTYSLLAWCSYRDISLPLSERLNDIVKNAKYAISLEMDNAFHYLSLTNYYLLTGNSDLTIETLERGLKYCQNKEDRTPFYQNLAGIYLEEGKYEKADSYIKMAVEIDGENSEGWLRYGAIMLKQDKIAEATEYFTRAINGVKMETASVGQLFYYYSYCCLRQYKCADAKEYINKALDIEPNNANYQSLYKAISECK